MPTKPLSISVPASMAKSKYSNPDPWLAFLRIQWPGTGSDPLRLVRNTENVSFDCGDGAGVQLYTAFAWEFSELTETADGSIPNWTIGVSNIRRMVEALTEQYGGGVGGNIQVFIVQASRLKREADLQYDFDIIGAKSAAKLVTWTLGAESPFRILMGRHLYSPDCCTYVYKGGLYQCPYTGDLPDCSYKLGGSNGCRAHFPGQPIPGLFFPGLDSNGMRVVQK